MTKITVAALVAVKISKALSGNIQQSTNSGSRINGGRGDGNGRGNGKGDGNSNGDINKLKAAGKEMMVEVTPTPPQLSLSSLIALPLQLPSLFLPFFPLPLLVDCCMCLPPPSLIFAARRLRSCHCHCPCHLYLIVPVVVVTVVGVVAAVDIDVVITAISP